MDPADYAEEALRALALPAMDFQRALAGGMPATPGLYALHGNEHVWRELGLGSPPDSRPLYFGKAERSLAARDVRTHFATGKTGSSSPRRSFAALLAASDAVDLHAIPRRPHAPEPKRWPTYALEPASDRRLTAWMRDNLRLAAWSSPPGVALSEIEKAVVKSLSSPLNLTIVTTPWTEQLRSARKALAAEARQWARHRGFDV